MNGFDWNGNDQRDMGDEYIDYRIAADDDGTEHKASKGGNGCVWGMLMALLILAIIRSL